MLTSATDFDLKALYTALDERRRGLGMTWANVAREIGLRFRDVPGSKAIAQSTITGLRTRQIGEADGILQMLLWLGRTPESFVPDVENADAGQYRLSEPGTRQILRFDTHAMYEALDALRKIKGMSWNAVASEMGIVSAGPLTNLVKGGRTAFPIAMRIVRWLGKPTAAFTRASDR